MPPPKPDTPDQIATAERTLRFLGRTLRASQYRLVYERRQVGQALIQAATTRVSIKHIRERIKRELRQHPGAFGGRFEASD